MCKHCEKPIKEDYYRTKYFEPIQPIQPNSRGMYIKVINDLVTLCDDQKANALRSRVEIEIHFCPVCGRDLSDLKVLSCPKPPTTEDIGTQTEEAPDKPEVKPEVKPDVVINPKEKEDTSTSVGIQTDKII